MGQHLQTFSGARSKFQLVQFHAGPGEVFRGHSHDKPHLFFLRDGDMEEDNGDHGATLKAGGVRASRAGVAHSLRFGSGGADCIAIHFNDGKLGAEVERRAGHANEFVHDNVVRQSSCALFDHMSSPETILLAELDILEMLASFENKDQDLPDWLQASHKLVRERVPGSTSVGALAREVGVSREHLARTYKKAFGATLNQTRRAVALTRATSLLKEFDISLADVAGEAGFFDQAHLCNALRAATGHSPTAMREHLTGRSQICKTALPQDG